MARVWLRILASVACLLGALWFTADGSHAHHDEWMITALLLLGGLVLGIDATLQRVRVAINRANERRRSDSS